MQKKFLVIPILFLGLAGVIASYGIAKADNTSTGPYATLIQKIAEKFGLNQTEVQAVFDEARGEQMAQMQEQNRERFQEQLDNMVENGKITSAQEASILAKHEEAQTQMQAMQGLTAEERKTAMEALREEMKTWAETNGIDMPFMMMGGFGARGGKGMGMGDGMIGFHGHGDCPFADEASTATE